ncbi:RNA pseudouridine synthase [bacterium]|nr:MAG: RNA pseudouridine synthase [bacterium]
MKKKKIVWGGWELPILYEDNDLLAISKPAGLLTVPIHKSKAVSAEFILNQAKHDSEGQIKAVHRIDRYTTGVVLFAKNRFAYKFMVRHFLAHEPKRVYHCWVHGVVKEEKGTLVHVFKLIDASFKNVPSTIADGGSEARLSYKVLHRYPNATHLQVELDTGLKNQIRAQFKEIGHPVIGERQYVEKPDGLLDRPALHAQRLEVTHPKTGKLISMKAEIPAELLNLDRFLLEMK